MEELYYLKEFNILFFSLKLFWFSTEEYTDQKRNKRVKWGNYLNKKVCHWLSWKRSKLSHWSKLSG